MVEYLSWNLIIYLQWDVLISLNIISRYTSPGRRKICNIIIIIEISTHCVLMNENLQLYSSRTMVSLINQNKNNVCPYYTSIYASKISQEVKFEPMVLMLLGYYLARERSNNIVIIFGYMRGIHYEPYYTMYFHF